MPLRFRLAFACLIYLPFAIISPDARCLATRRCRHARQRRPLIFFFFFFYVDATLTRQRRPSTCFADLPRLPMLVREDIFADISVAMPRHSAPGAAARRATAASGARRAALSLSRAPPHVLIRDVEVRQCCPKDHRYVCAAHAIWSFARRTICATTRRPAAEPRYVIHAHARKIVAAYAAITRGVMPPASVLYMPCRCLTRPAAAFVAMFAYDIMFICASLMRPSRRGAPVLSPTDRADVDRQKIAPRRHRLFRPPRHREGVISRAFFRVC